MGIIYTTIKIRNPFPNNAGQELETEAKVDSGATLLVLPKSIVDEFGFKKIREQTVKYANEDTAVRDIVGPVEMEICGRKGYFEAIVEPKKKYALIGAVVMESLDLIIEPRSLGIYPNPRSKLPMAEIE
jgi:clan AA aspartic protease